MNSRRAGAWGASRRRFLQVSVATLGMGAMADQALAHHAAKAHAAHAHKAAHHAAAHHGKAVHHVAAHRHGAAAQPAAAAHEQVAQAAPAPGDAAAILAAARAGLARAGGRVIHADVVGVADFSRPSREPRFHLVDTASGRIDSLLVAHGRGSDPGHTGWLKSFSNRPGSDATSQGDYVTGAYYDGHHGRSMRLDGLDPTNSNAMERAIVVHAAWYVGPDVVRQHGVLGRSEGCFAVSAADLEKVLNRLGPGRLLIATKV